MSLNISFEYLYRDAGNYKLFRSLVFHNGTNLSLEEVKPKIEEQLIDGEYFIPENWGIERLSFESFIPELDHEWHELIQLKETVKSATDSRDITEFIKEISK